jgi:hypothetical protein
MGFAWRLIGTLRDQKFLFWPQLLVSVFEQALGTWGLVVAQADGPCQQSVLLKTQDN